MCYEFASAKLAFSSEPPPMFGNSEITFDLIFPKLVENLIQVAAFSSNAACSKNALALKILSS